MARNPLTKFKLGVIGSVGALLFVAACSPGGAGLTGPSGDAAAETTANATANEWVPGPLDEFQMRIGGWDPNQQETASELQARAERESREQQEFIAACMSELGFNYTPVPMTVTVQVADPTAGPQQGTLEWAEQWGYGISTDPWSEGAGGGTSWGWGPAGEDPNQAMVDAMSDAEREAWNEALWGQPQEDGEWDPMQAGCQGQANAARWETISTPNQFEALEAEMNQIWTQTENDPRMATLNAAWASCLTDAGHPGFTATGTIWEQLWPQWDQLQGWELNNEVFGNWDWETYPDGPSEDLLHTPDPAAVAEFREREISLAVADQTCRQQVNFEQVSRDISHDIQQQFVDQHRAELEAWATYMETQRG